MKLLDAVNVILPKLGERPVTSLDEPNSSVDVILPVIEVHRTLLLQHGWWFQRIRGNVLRNAATNRYEVQHGAMAFYATDPSKAVLFDGYLIHPETGSPYDVEGPVHGVTILDIPFDDLPPVAQTYIMYTAGIQVLEDSLNQSEMLAWREGKAMAFDMLTTNEARTVQPREVLNERAAHSIVGGGAVHGLQWTGANYRVV